jgi:Ca-activated chloride channel homolog
VLPAQAFAAIAHSELVERRLLELEAARLLTLAREAALQGHWDTVQSILAEAAQRLGGQEWLKEILVQIVQLADEKDHQAFSKEAMYSAMRMCSRLTDHDDLMKLDEETKPSFLRRKKAQGKAEFERRGVGRGNEDTAPCLRASGAAEQKGEA